MSFLAAFFVCVGMLVVLTPPASAAPNVKVSVTLQRIRALASSEEGLCGTVDWYAKVWINGEEFNNEDSPSQDELEGNSDISPDWEFSKEVDVATLDQSDGVAKVPVKIEVWDEDGVLCLGDDQYDASPTASKAIEFSVGVAPCQVFMGGGGGSGCGGSLISSGTDDDRAEVTFGVDVEEPASAPGLRIPCTHAPIMPQYGRPVTITATALDGAMAPTVVADELEIVAVMNVPGTSERKPVADKKVSGVNSTSVTLTPTSGDGDLVYGCRLRKGGTTIFSGWHRVGMTQRDLISDEPIPVIYTGPRSSRIDIVFIPDSDTYTIFDDPQFLKDVAQVINTSYYGFNEFLAAQDKFNFWIMRDMGRADDANDGDCDHEIPDNWDDELAFADAGAILHRKNQRDCALRGDRIFSAVVDPTVRSDALQVATHETGHQPFGLADEYCCDGGYFEQDTAPNVYEEPEGCADDAPALGRTGAACREWERPTDWWFDPDWSTSEPGSNDLMNDNGQAQAADVRRFNLIFNDCNSAKC
jgi:hypothetical protein